MPIRKQITMVPSRMKMSMLSAVQSKETSSRCCADRVDWRTEEHAFDDEEEEADAADRDRQVGDADRQEREIGDGVVPGHLDQPLAVDDHEQRDQRHQQLHENIEHPLPAPWQAFGEIGDVHVQVEPVAGRGADESEHDGEQDRERLRP